MKIAGIYTVIFLLFLAGCTESTTVGGEILDQDQAALVAIDTLTIRTATVADNELVVYNPTALPFANSLCGHYEDPILGTVRADFYGQFQVNEIALPFFPDIEMDTVTYDSVVLVLEYDLDGIYGDSMAIHEFEIYEITAGQVDEDSTYVSGNELPIEDAPLTSIRFRPSFEGATDFNTIVVIDSMETPPDTTFGTFGPFLSIKLPDAMISRLLEIHDLNLDQSNDAFLGAFGGLAIRPVGGPTASILNFNFGAAQTGLRLHYTVGTTQNVYQYNVTTTSVQFSSFDNEPAPEIVAAIAGEFESGTTTTYIQGMTGPSTLVQIPYISDFKDEVVVNNAELIVTIQPETEEEFYPSVTQIIASYRNDDGELIAIEDFVFAFGGLGLEVFGGQPESFTGLNGETLTRYRINIGGHLQRMISEELPNELYLRVLQKNERANRTVLYGAEHPQYPVTLNANFTNLN